MSQAQAAVNSANGQELPQGTSTQTDGDVVAFPQTSTPNPQPPVNNGDHTKFPMTKPAYDYLHATVNEYVDAVGRKQRETRRHYLPIPAIQDIVKALGRQMTEADIDLLVGIDGEAVKCAVTQRDFIPMWWVLILPNLLDAIAKAKALNEDVLRKAQVVKVGQFFPNPDRNATEHYAVAGVPYYWKKGTDNAFATWSPLFKVKKLNGNRWGDHRMASEQILARREALRKEKETLNQGLTSLAAVFQSANRGRANRK